MGQTIYLIIRAMGLWLTAVSFCLHAKGQNGPLKYKSPFILSDCDTLLLETSASVPDSSLVSFSLLQFRLASIAETSFLFIAISNSGSILAFRDSSAKIPVLLEKRSGFPFARLKVQQKIKLIYTRSPGEGDYLGFRLQDNSASNRILDEVVLCCRSSILTANFLNYRGWLKQN